MKCAEFEILLSDYLDGTLDAGGRSALEQHAAVCAACRDFMRDVSVGAEFLGRAEKAMPPQELVTRIAYQAPRGRIRDTFQSQGVFNKLIAKWLQPILQPRLVMGMAMTLLSFTMLERCTGVHIQHIQAADLNPARIWDDVEDRAIRAKDRVVKYYENARLVYEIEARLRTFQEQQEAAQSRPPAQGKAESGTKNGTTKTPHEGGNSK